MKITSEAGDTSSRSLSKGVPRLRDEILTSLSSHGHGKVTRSRRLLTGSPHLSKL